MKFKEPPIDPAYNYPLYYPYRHLIQTGDLMEWSTDHNSVAWLIQKKTGQDVNHSAMFVRSVMPGHVDRIFLLEAVAEGVVSSLFTNRLESHHGKVWWIPLNDQNVTRQQRIEMLYWSMTQIGLKKGYDFEDLLNQLTGSVFLDYNRFFCSEYYHAALIEGGIVPPNSASKAKRPGEFMDFGVHLPRVLVYEG